MDLSEEDIFDFCDSELAHSCAQQIKLDMAVDLDADAIYLELKKKLDSAGISIDLLRESETYKAFKLFKKLLSSDHFVDKHFDGADISKIKIYIDRMVYLIGGYS